MRNPLPAHCSPFIGPSAKSVIAGILLGPAGEYQASVFIQAKRLRWEDLSAYPPVSLKFRQSAPLN
jgi:hypothetical protein